MSSDLQSWLTGVIAGTEVAKKNCAHGGYNRFYDGKLYAFRQVLNRINHGRDREGPDVSDTECKDTQSTEGNTEGNQD